MSSPADRTPHDRFALGALEFDVVRDLLTARLTSALGRHDVAALVPFERGDDARAALAEADELAQRFAADDRPPVGGAVEIRSWMDAFFAGEHQPETRDLADLKRLLRATSRCAAWLVRNEQLVALVRLGQSFPVVADIAAELEAVVDDRGEVLNSASVRLAELRAEIERAEAGVRAAAQRFVADESIRRCLQSVEPAWRHGRPVFQVRQDMRNRVPGVLHDRSQSGATLFIEPAVVVEAANRLSDARAAEHREVQVVIAQVCRGLRRWRTEIEAAVQSMSALDVAMARARLIHEDGFLAPTVVEDGPLVLRRAVHPLLLAAGGVESGDGESVVPLDVEIGGSWHMLVITGPNTGGKTVALKTIGLLASMALSGVPIPAERGTQVPTFDGVFADIGDEQAISQNLSTFSSHLTRIVRCLDAATERSLVLLDELGAGTDPEEGGSLGYAVLEELTRRRCNAVVTTHLGRLKQFAYQNEGVENGAMAFDGATLSPLYRLDVGVPGTSHALDIAGRVGVPAALVSRARELLGRRDERIEEELGRVQEARRRAEEERLERERLRLEAEEQSAELDSARADLEKRRLWVHEEADALLDEELRAARTLVEKPLRELAAAPGTWGARAKQLVEDLGGLLGGTSLHRRRMQFVGSLRKNAIVWVPSLGKRCTVRKVDRTREVITLDLGSMRMDVPFEDVSWVQPLDAS